MTQPMLKFERVEKTLTGYDEMRCMEMAVAYVKKYNITNKHLRSTFAKFYADLLLFSFQSMEEQLLELILLDNVIFGRRKGSSVVVFTICKREDVDNLEVN